RRRPKPRRVSPPRSRPVAPICADRAAAYRPPRTLTPLVLARDVPPPRADRRRVFVPRFSGDPVLLVARDVGLAAGTVPQFVRAGVAVGNRLLESLGDSTVAAL